MKNTARCFRVLSALFVLNGAFILLFRTIPGDAGWYWRTAVFSGVLAASTFWIGITLARGKGGTAAVVVLMLLTFMYGAALIMATQVGFQNTTLRSLPTQLVQIGVVIVLAVTWFYFLTERARVES